MSENGRKGALFSMLCKIGFLCRAGDFLVQSHMELLDLMV